MFLGIFDFWVFWDLDGRILTSEPVPREEIYCRIRISGQNLEIQAPRGQKLGKTEIKKNVRRRKASGEGMSGSWYSSNRELSPRLAYEQQEQSLTGLFAISGSSGKASGGI